MSRSIKKGPFVDPSLQDKIDEAQKTNSRKPIQTWSRRSVIAPVFTAYTPPVHNGRKFVAVYVTENMVGHKLGEFSPTRLFKGHQPHTKKATM